MTQQAAFQFIASINLNMCRLYKDFGKGFYLSSGKNRAGRDMRKNISKGW